MNQKKVAVIVTAVATAAFTLLAALGGIPAKEWVCGPPAGLTP